ncbi:MAG: competence/damage-inducible protein A [Deltaproteobacteria bacterium]|nr:competence/damage-inducible protein A [Deltaproteobacteria bacterium]
MHRVVLLAQGNELTTGQTVDTNSNWIAEQLFPLGIEVVRVVTVPDDLEQLVEVLRDAVGRAPLVISTGGLGPTRDDLTAEAVAAAFERPLALDTVALAQVEARYAAMGRPMPAINRKQAVLPGGALVHENRWGTAPAFSVQAHGAHLFFLPGVPREMRSLMVAEVIPHIQEIFALRAPRRRIVRVIGLGESTIEMRLGDLNIPGMSIGFRTKMPENQVKLRFSPDLSESEVESAVREVRRRIGWRAFGVDCGDLGEVVGHSLAEREQTVALAESCTAGAVTAWLGRTPGASRYLVESAVLYANEAKTRTCGVSQAMLTEHGAVSEPVARQLAEAIRARAGTTWGVGITGIAGPGGGTPEKPVGTVHIAVAGPTGTVHQQLRLPGDRGRVQSLAAAAALALLFRSVTSPIEA